MRKGHGVIGRAVTWAGRKWIVRGVAGGKLKLRPLYSQLRATVPRTAVKFARGSYEVKAKRGDVIVRSTRGL